jgi:hypothetical protein
MRKTSMRRIFASAVCAALVATSFGAAKADPIVATAYLTIGPDLYVGGQTWSGSTTIANPTDPQLGITSGSVYNPIDFTIDTSLIPHLSSQGTTDAGPYGLIHNIQTTYDMRIYFGPSTTPDIGAQQPNPYVEITGNATGFIYDGPKGQELAATPSTLSLVLKNDTSASAIPANLLNLFTNPSGYMIWGGETLTVPGGQEGTVLMQITYSTAPEPASWLVFAGALGAAAIRFRRRRQRS